MHNAAMRRPAPIALLLSACMIPGCAHWETTSTLGDSHEVARRLVGSPQIEEVTSTSLAAGGVAGARPNMSGGGTVGAGIAGSHETIKRTHCVQQADVDYVQDVNYEQHVEGRTKDVVAGLVIGGVGLLLGLTAYRNYKTQTDDYNAGFTTTKPDSPNGGYALAGAAVVVGGGWLVYSFAALPKGAAPVRPPSQKTWTETTYVEASGCGLVPADRPTPAPAPVQAPAPAY